jgi:16S rRNA processing protein RimM
MDDLLQTATVGAAYGLDGELKIYPNNTDATNLKKLKKVVLEDSDGSRLEVDVASSRMVGGQLVMHFGGYDSPEKAKLLSRRLLFVPREDAYALKKGEVYAADLVGCALLFDGKRLATVKSTIDGPQSLLLEAEDGEGNKHLVPYLKEYISKTDIEGKRIDLACDWILS